MELNDIIFEATKRLSFLVEGFDFSRRLNRAHEELDVLQAFFIKELETVRVSLWPIREAEEFVAKALDQIEIAQKSVTYFNFEDAHFHANSAHGFLSRLSVSVSMGSELEKLEKSTLWNGLTYGFGIAFVLYLVVFALVSIAVFFIMQKCDTALHERSRSSEIGHF